LKHATLKAVTAALLSIKGLVAGAKKPERKEAEPAPELTSGVSRDVERKERGKPRWKPKNNAHEHIRTYEETLVFLGWPEGRRGTPCKNWHGPWFYCTGFCEQPDPKASWDDIWLDEERLNRENNDAKKPKQAQNLAVLDEALRAMGMLAEGTKPTGAPEGRKWWKASTVVGGPPPKVSVPYRHAPSTQKRKATDGGSTATNAIPSRKNPFSGNESRSASDTPAWGGTSRPPLNPAGKPWSSSQPSRTGGKGGNGGKGNKGNTDTSGKIPLAPKGSPKIHLNGCGGGTEEDPSPALTLTHILMEGWSEEEVCDLFNDYGDVLAVCLYNKGAGAGTAIVTFASHSQAVHVSRECDVSEYGMSLNVVGAAAKKSPKENQLLQEVPVWEDEYEGVEGHGNVDDGRDAASQLKTKHNHILQEVLGARADEYRWDVYEEHLRDSCTDADAFLSGLEATLGELVEEMDEDVHTFESEYDCECPLCGTFMSTGLIEEHAWSCLESCSPDTGSPGVTNEPEDEIKTELGRGEGETYGEWWWFYLDDEDDEQGPYAMDHMRSWFEAGYFEPDRRVRADGSTGYHTIEKCYPEGTTAFALPPAIHIEWELVVQPPLPLVLEPGTSECPFCGLCFPLGILEGHVAKHMELEAQNTTIKPKAKPKSSGVTMVECPVCQERIPVSKIDQHVEECLSLKAISQEDQPHSPIKECEPDTEAGFWDFSAEKICPQELAVADTHGICPVCEDRVHLDELEAHVNGHF